MRIAILCHMHHPISEPFAGGTEAHTFMLANELVARGHDVTMFAKDGSKTAAALYPLVPKDFEFINSASPLVRVQQRGFLAEAVQHSIEIIRDSSFDAVINSSLSSLPFAYMPDIAMLTILHTPPTLVDVTAVVTKEGWTPGARHAWATVSESNADAWRQLLPKVITVPNGVDLSAWLATAPPTPGLAVWTGRITPEKGLHVAIDAAAEAAMRIEIAGPIADVRYFREEIQPRLGARVEYRGHLDHAGLCDLISSASVFISSPLWAEPFGLAAVEALAVGTPVAALPHGALPEIITSANGALASGATASALAAAIRIAATRDRGATAHSALRYDFHRMVDDYVCILDSLLREDPVFDSGSFGLDDAHVRVDS